MNNLRPIAKAVQSQGRGDDTQLIHMTPKEVKGLQALAMANGGSLTINPSTGLPEAGFLDSLLPTLIGVGITAATGGAAAPWMVGLGVGGLQAARTGSLSKGLMAGLGAYGGAGLAGSLLGTGAATAATAAGNAGAAATPTNAAIGAANSGVAAGGPGIGISAAQNAASNQAAANFGLQGLPASSVAAPVAPSVAQLGGVPLATPMPAVTPSAFQQMGAGLQAAGNAPGSFLANNYGKIGMALTPALVDSMQPDAGPGYEPDTEQYQYDYSPNRASEEDLAAQRQAYANNGITGGELQYFRPAYSNMRTVNVAKGGLIGLAEGGMPDAYTYDPVTQTYKLKAPTVPTAPAGAVAPVGINPIMQGSSDNREPMTDAQFAQQQMQGAINLESARQAMFGAPEFTGAVQQVDMSTPYGNSPSGVVSSSAPAGGGGGGGGSSGRMGDGYNSGNSYQSDPMGATGIDGSTENDSYYANGGIAMLAQGGHLGGYSDGGQLLRGPGDGVSDDIPASIEGAQPARLADGEFVVPARIVSELGNGSTEAGSRRLYAMMNRIQANRKKTVGKGNVAVDSKSTKLLPA